MLGSEATIWVTAPELPLVGLRKFGWLKHGPSMKLCTGYEKSLLRTFHNRPVWRAFQAVLLAP